MEEDQKMSGREKYWSEINDKEKIRRLRQQVKNLECRFQIYSDKVEQLLKHNHRVHGEIVTPMRDFQEPSIHVGQRLENLDDVYF